MYLCLNMPNGNEVQSVPEKASRLPAQDDLQLLAKSVRGVVHEDGGQFFASLRRGRYVLHQQFANREQAMNALQHVFDEDNAARTLDSKVAQTVRRRKIDVPEAPMNPKDLDPTLELDKRLYGERPALVGDPEEFITGFLPVELAHVIPARGMIRRIGPEGQLLVQMFDRMRELHARLYGKGIALLDKSLEQLTPDEIGEGIFAHAHSGAPLSEQAQQAFQILTSHADKLYESARYAGVRVAEKLEKYFPYVYNVARLNDPQYEQNMIQKLVERGVAKDAAQAQEILVNRSFGTSRQRAIHQIMDEHRAAGRTNVTQTEAADILDRFIRENNSFISGHLERERLGNLDPIHDARVAYGMAFYRNSRRVAEAEVLGAHYERPYQLIDSIRDQYGPRAADTAKIYLDAELGRLRQRIPEPFDYLYDMQAMKLSFAVISNATQSYNTLTRVGFRAFAEGLFKGIREDILPAIKAGRVLDREQRSLMREHVRSVGSTVEGILSDFNDQQAGLLLTPEDVARMNQPIRKGIRTVREALTAPFNLVESFNRIVATRSGEAYGEGILRDLADPARAAAARRRLTELRINASPVEQLITEGRADLLDELKLLIGQRISNETQFVSNPSTRPLWSNHPLGQFVYQFKQFALSQASFMQNEMFGKYEDTARRMRAWGLVLSLAPSLGYGTTWMRDKVYGTSVSGDFLRHAQADGEWMQKAISTLGLIASVGSLGIVADLAATAYSGNQFALQNFFISPSVSTMINMLSVGGAAARAVAHADTNELDKGVQKFSREFGGYGTAAYRLGHTIATGEPGPERKRSSSGGGFGLQPLSF